MLSFIMYGKNTDRANFSIEESYGLTKDQEIKLSCHVKEIAF